MRYCHERNTAPRYPGVLRWLTVVVLLLVMSGLDVFAQTPTFSIQGTGSGAANNFPLNTTSSRKTQHNYIGGEFTGAYAGLITTIYFKRGQAQTATSTFTNLTVWLGQVASSAFPSTTTFHTPMTQVYTAASTVIGTGAVDTWFAITLNNPFAYDPSQGLVVQLCQDGYTPSGILLRQYTQTTPPYRRIYGTTTCTSTSGSGTDGARYDFGFDMTAPGPMNYVSSTTIQNNTAPAGVGSINQEIIGMQVVTSGGQSPLSVTSFTLNTAGSTSAADISSAKVYYTGGSNVFSTATAFGAPVANPSGAFTVNGSQTLLPGTNYFWLAYDISPAASAGNVVDGQCNSITVAGIPRTPTVTNPAGSRSLVAVMNGIYTINPSGSGSRNFTSFNNAITALNATGISGPVTFQVAAATYTETFSIGPVAGASAANTITFDGGTGNTASRIVSYSVGAAYGSVITLNGADYIKFKNLTVNSTNGSYGYGFLLTNQANYNEISNCIINLPTNTTSSYHIGIVANSTSSYSSSGDWANYCLIQNNTINSGYYGVSWWGSSSSSLTTNVGNEFIGNTIQDWYYMGMYLYYSAAIKVNDNIVTQRSGSGSSGYAIYGYYHNDGPQFIGNYLRSNYNAMRVLYANQYYTVNTNRGKIVNNMTISDGTSTTYGLYCSYPRYTDIVYNSVYTRTTSTCYGFYQYGSSSTYDNKVANNYIVHEGNSTWYAIYNYYSTDMSMFDYNAYYRIGTGTDTYLWNGSSYASLAALQTATTTVHDNSVVGNPYFISRTDLHSRSHVGYQAGTPFTGITDDYDGDLRNGLTPSIGADEYPAPPAENDLGAVAVRLDYGVSKWARRENPGEQTVSVVVANTGLAPNPATVAVTYKLGSAPANSLDGVSQTFSPIWDASNRTALTFTQPLSGLAPNTNATVYATVFHTGDEVPANDGASDTRWIDNIKVHGHENFDRFVPPTFDDIPGYLTTRWAVDDVNGGTTWEVAPAVGTGGSNAMQYAGDGQTADDWVFSPAVELVAGSSYRISLNLRSISGSPQTVEVAFGQSPTPAAMTTFATFANFTNTAFMTAKALAGGLDPYFNTPNVNGLYYLGIRVTSGAGMGEVAIDDVVLDDNPSPPPKIGYGLPGSPITSFIDNPAIPIKVTAVYKQPGLINRTYQVASTTNIYGAAGDFLWDVESSTPWISLTKETPDPTLQGYNLTPPRPRQFQTFTMTINPSGLAPGVHLGSITFYGILFNYDFPPPANGLVATNEPFVVPVELRISATGSKGGATSMTATMGPLTVPGSPYHFTDPGTGDPIATVQVTGGQIDVMTITVFPNQLPTNITRFLYVTRYWQITHTGTGWTADITFPYADQEAAMILDRYQLRGVRQATPLSRWEDPIGGTNSISDPLTNTVMVQNFNETNIGGNIALAHPYFLAKNGEGTLPTAFTLAQNYPNPFNPSTAVSFTVAEERHVRLMVYNSLGVEVAELVNESLPAGRYEVAFDASNLPSGTYVYTMISGDFVQTRRMTLAK
jgi:hypothetical protein